MAEAVDVGAELAAHCADRLQCGGQGADCSSGGVIGADVIAGGIVGCAGVANSSITCGSGKGVGSGEFVGRASQPVAQTSKLSGCIKRQLLGAGGASLECHCCAELASSACSAEQLFTVELGVVEDAVQFFTQLVILGLHRRAVCCTVRAAGSLGGQVFHALQDVGDFVEGAVGGLQHRRGIGDVAHGDFHTTALRVQAGGNLQAGGVISGAVDAKAGAQALLAGGQGAADLVQVARGAHCCRVAMNRKCHEVCALIVKQ
ncbi:hypothetical protein D3C77_336020 [compost metagenome]